MHKLVKNIRELKERCWKNEGPKALSEVQSTGVLRWVGYG